MNPNVEIINCPYCNESKSSPWASENGFMAVKCSECGFVYVNPRPIQSLISEAIETGIHSNVEHGRTAITRRIDAKVSRYKKILSSMFSDVWHPPRKISWLDVGAGYGEVINAVSELAPMGSQIEGIEPMGPKVNLARMRGLKISEKYLCDVTERFDFVSIVNVYSHIADFRTFLEETKRVLVDNGEIFIETGNAGDLVDSHELPSELNLPDHLVFAGERHIIGYLTEAGFSVVAIKRARTDGFVNFAKNIIKKLIGRQVVLAIPYTSSYRSMFIRAKLHSSASTQEFQKADSSFKPDT